MLNIHTGPNHLLAGELCRVIASVDPDTDIYVIVPRQLTLLTEQTIMRGLSIESSFRIQVYNSSRICKLIFDEAGYPDGDRIDERGRVMLCRRALHDVRGELSVYRDAEKRGGFAPRCAEQIEIMIQGGLTHDKLLEIADIARGSDAHKLRDLSIIMRRYTELTEGLYRDTETELIDATSKVSNAPFIKKGCFIFYGFSITPPTLTNFAASIAANAKETHILFPLKNDSDSPDYDCYRPMEKTLNRLLNACKDLHVAYTRVAISAKSDPDAITSYADQLYSALPERFNGDTHAIRAFTARTIREECNCIAAIARKLCREEDISYGDMQILCTDPNLYRAAMKESFEAYDVPLMFDAGRPVSRVGAAELLLFALKTTAEGYRMHDVIALIRTGYCGIKSGEADQLENYAIQNGIDGTRWLRPFTRGKDDVLAKVEEYRSKIIMPLKELHDGLVKANTLKQQLTAMFEYLTGERVNALNACRESAEYCSANGRNMEADLISQSWNRLISTLDMMHDLLGEESLSLNELYQTLGNALDVSLIKVLPQTADSVYVQSAGTLLQSNPRVIFAVGLYDRTTGSGNSLLLPNQQRLITEQSGAYLGPGEEDAPLQRRFFLKESLPMALDYLYLSCSMVDFDGAIHKKGEELRMLSQILPDVKLLTVNDFIDDLLGAVQPALDHSAFTYGVDHSEKDFTVKASLAALSSGDIDIKTQLDQISHLKEGLSREEYVEPEHAGKLYRNIDTLNISQLERFAKCPFDHFVQFGLRPEPVEPFEMTFADIGNFLHGCMNDFLIANKDQLNSISPEEAENRMRDIAERYAEKIEKAANLIADSAVSRQNYSDLIDRACACAFAVATHMRQSRFAVTDTELRFNSKYQAEDFAMKGSIDRIDTWQEGNRIRVVDFKSSDHKVDPAELLDGSALQLAVYMGVAEKETNAQCAGMYYFPMLEPYITDESRAESDIEKKRLSEFRMTGIHSADPDIIFAQTDTPEVVFASGMTAKGTARPNSPVATDEDFRRIIRHVSDKICDHMSSIRKGDARVYPLKNGERSACTYCKHASACLFDPKLQSERVIKPITWDKMLYELILENDQPD